MKRYRWFGLFVDVTGKAYQKLYDVVADSPDKALFLIREIVAYEESRGSRLLENQILSIQEV